MKMVGSFLIACCVFFHRDDGSEKIEGTQGATLTTADLIAYIVHRRQRRDGHHCHGSRLKTR